MKAARLQLTTTGTLVFAVSLTLLGCAGVAWGQEKKEEAGERKLSMKDLPPAVQKTVQEQSKGGSIQGLTLETEEGKDFYELELKVSGRIRDVTMDSSGAVVKIEQEITISSLPPAVRAAIEKGAGKGKIVLVESVTEQGVLVLYEAHVKTGATETEIKVDPKGNVIPEPQK